MIQIGIDMYMGPTIANNAANTLPASVSGWISPYPTVESVIIAKYKEVENE
jgi:hypothetical protein